MITTVKQLENIVCCSTIMSNGKVFFKAQQWKYMDKDTVELRFKSSSNDSWYSYDDVKIKVLEAYNKKARIPISLEVL